MSVLALPLLSPKSPSVPAARHSNNFHRRPSIVSNVVPSISHQSLALPLSSPRLTSSLPKKGSGWRWWHCLSLIVGLLGFVECIALFSINFYGTSHDFHQSNRIAVRQYPSIPYKHVNLHPVEGGTRVYHVAKEFGPATMSDLGSMVTSLAAAQQRSNGTEVSIVMPFYSFLKNKHAMQRLVSLTVEIGDPASGLTREENPLQWAEHIDNESVGDKLVKGHVRQDRFDRPKHRGKSMEFHVWRMQYAFRSPETTIELIDGENKTVVHEPNAPVHEMVTVYLIGHGNRAPFHHAFRARNTRQMNDDNNEKIIAALPPDWRDQYFCRAAAAFLRYQATAVNEESLFAPVLRPLPNVDIIHMHGTALSSIARYLSDMRTQEKLGPKPPSLIYTMHDPESELHYVNSLRSIRLFSDSFPRRTPGQNQLMFRSQQWMMYMSSLGIDHSDIVTFVSQTKAADLVEGRRAPPLKELIMDEVLQKAARGRFFGINNAIDIQTRGPFIDNRLASRKLLFPDFAWRMLTSTTWQSNTTTPVVWSLSPQPNDHISTAKDRAKRYLFRRKILTNDELEQSLVLLSDNLTRIGSPEMTILTTVARECVQQGMLFIVVSQLPEEATMELQMRELETLSTEGPGRVILITTDKEQRQFDVFLRAAADVMFTPFLTGNAVYSQVTDGLLFAASLITPESTAADLTFLINRPRPARPERVQYEVKGKSTVVTSEARHNAYLYNPSNTMSIKNAVVDAAEDLRHASTNKALREEYVLRMTRHAVDQNAGRPGGTVDEYNAVYALALQDRPIPNLSRHELEEEQALLHRLKHNDIFSQAPFLSPTS